MAALRFVNGETNHGVCCGVQIRVTFNSCYLIGVILKYYTELNVSFPTFCGLSVLLIGTLPLINSLILIHFCFSKCRFADEVKFDAENAVDCTKKNE